MLNASFVFQGENVKIRTYLYKRDVDVKLPTISLGNKALSDTDMSLEHLLPGVQDGILCTVRRGCFSGGFTESLELQQYEEAQ